MPSLMIRSNKVLAKVKARTTHEDLSIGLNEAVEKGWRQGPPGAIGR